MIQIDKDKKLIVCEQDGDNKIYVTYPVIGLENFQLPIYINSRNFKLDQKRSKLEKNSKNEELLKKSINLYGLLTNYCIENKITNTTSLFKSLDCKKLNDSTFADFYSWYIDNAFYIIVETLFNYPVVYTLDGFVNVEEAVIPYLKSNNNEKNANFYQLIISSGLYPKNITSFEDSLEWKKISNSIGNNTIKFITPKDFYENVKQNYISLPNSFRKKLLDYLVTYDKDTLEKYEFIPTIDGKSFVKYSKDIFKCDELTNNAVSLLQEFNSKWNQKLISNDIDWEYLPKQNAKTIISDVFSKISDNPDIAFALLRYLPQKDNNGMQKELYTYANKLGLCEECIILGDYEADLWRDVNLVAVEKMVSIIEEGGTINDIGFDFNKFIEFISSIININRISNRSIVPNKNGRLCKRNELYNSVKVCNEIVDSYCRITKINIDEKIKDSSFKVIICESDFTIDTFIEYINQNIQDYKSNIENISIKELINRQSKEILSLIPPQNASFYKKQVETFNIFCIIHGEKDAKTSDINCQDERIWSSTNDLIIDELSTILNQYSSINDIISNNEYIKEKKTVIDMCNFLLNYTETDVKVPDRNGIFHKSNELKSAPYIKDVSLEFIERSTGENNSKLLVDEGIISTKIETIGDLDFLKDIKNKLSNVNSSGENISKIYIENPQFSDDLFSREIGEEITLLQMAQKIFNAKNNLDHSILNNCKWVWEMIQNALDSTARKVSMWINLNNDYVDVINDGDPFTRTQIHSLIFAFSSKYNENKIGRFGSGFLTLLLLSGIIEVKANVKSENGEIKRVKFTLNREGNDMEKLKNDGKNTLSEMKEIPRDTDKTEFRFILNTERGKDTVNAGIKEINQNIFYVLAFSPNFDKLVINNNSTIFKMPKETIFEREKEEKEGKLLKTVIAKRINGKTTNFSVFKTTCSSDVTGAVMIDEFNNKIFNHKDSIFFHFPIIGDKLLQLPFVVNSKFAISSDRNSLNLNDEENKKRINLFTNQIFDDLMEFCCQKKLENMFIPVSLLKYDEKVTENEEQKVWYEKVLKIMREKMCTKEIVKTKDGIFKKLSIPTEVEYNDRKIIKFDLSSDDKAIIFNDHYEKNDKGQTVIEPNMTKLLTLFVKTFPNHKDMLKWEKSIWDKSYVLTPSVLLENIEMKEYFDNIEVFVTKEDDENMDNSDIKYSAFNMMINATKNHYFFAPDKNYRVVPSMSGKLMIMSELMKCKCDCQFLEIIRQNFEINKYDNILNERIKTDLVIKTLDYCDIENDIQLCFEKLKEQGDKSENKEECYKKCVKVSNCILGFKFTSWRIGEITSEDFENMRHELIKLHNILYKEEMKIYESSFNSTTLYEYAYYFVIWDINENIKNKSIDDFLREDEFDEKSFTYLLNCFYKLCIGLSYKKNIYVPNENRNFVSQNSIYIPIDKEYKRVVIHPIVYDLSEKIGLNYRDIILKNTINFNRCKNAYYKELLKDIKQGINKKWKEIKERSNNNDKDPERKQYNYGLKEEEKEIFRQSIKFLKLIYENDPILTKEKKYRRFRRKMYKFILAVNDGVDPEDILKKELIEKEEISNQNASIKSQIDDLKSQLELSKQTIEDIKKEKEEYAQKLSAYEQEIEKQKEEYAQKLSAYEQEIEKQKEKCDQKLSAYEQEYAQKYSVFESVVLNSLSSLKPNNDK